MPKVARIGDIGIGYCQIHRVQTGKIINCSIDTFAEGKGVARQGDMVIAGCGHSGTLIKVSNTVFVNGKGMARVGDTFAGIFSGTIVTGASTVEAN